MRQSIMEGTLGSGDRLVVDRLAERYGVSQTPVREALARLIQDGIVEEIGPGRLRIVPVTHCYVRDIYRVRSALEGLASELATPRMNHVDVENLAKLVEEADTAIRSRDFILFEEKNQELHWKVVESSGNKILIREIESFQLHVVYIRQFFVRVVEDATERLMPANEEHALVVDAMSRNDPEGARRRMEQHIRNAGRRLGALVDWRQD
jgi:DNA-binding GntR family transcriptional regulator